jgi:hypothetical protein
MKLVFYILSQIVTSIILHKWDGNDIWASLLLTISIHLTSHKN